MRKLPMNKGFCPAPFTTLIINADGKVGCCREKGSEHSIGNALEQSLDEIWNGEEIQKWRQEFLTGNVQTCKKEQHDMSCNLFKHNMELLPLVSYEAIQKGPILRFSPDINGRCNLKCPMCIVWKKPNGKYDLVPNFWEDLEANVIPHLKIMDPLSGEPFIQEDLYKIIRMSAKVNPNCRWNFTTNAQWVMTKEIKDHLDLIKIDLISVSVDTVEHDTYAKIRKGGDLQILKRNIVSLIDYVNDREKRTGEKINLMLNFTLQSDNAYELQSMFDYSKSVGLNAMILFLYDPSEMSLENWSEENKVELLKHYFEKMDQRLLIISNRLFMAVIRSLKDEMIRKKMFSIYNIITDGNVSRISQSSENPLEYLKKMAEQVKHE
jgi:radical SAM protein with 4Fe4S-binding SPASM domain